MHALEAKNITKIYSSRKKQQRVTALNDFSLTIEPGEVFGLLGPNGAGKTTFIKVLLSIVYPTSGSASLLGVDIKNAKAKERIGYLPENHRYPPYLTGEQVLSYFGKLSGLQGDTLKKRIDEMLALTGMEKKRSVRIRKYSKGMMQRIGLAQALINKPDIVFLDEPTDGVDPLGRKQIRDLLSHVRNSGKTVFLNSHLLSEVELICDRVAILNEGELLRTGTVQELTTQSQVFDLAFQGEIPESLRVQWDATRTGIAIEGNILHLSSGGIDVLNQIIDHMRASGILIERITQKKVSLEDMFIETIGNGK